MNRPWRGGGLVGPLILIALGVIFLLNNLGVVNWDTWEIVLRLWPLVLIAIGLDILVGRRSLLGSIIVLVIVIILLAGGVWLVSSQASFGAQALNTETINQSLQGATSADVEIDPSVASLRLGSTQSMNRSDLPADLLIIGTVATGGDEHLTRNLQVTGNTARFVLKTQGVPFFPFVGPRGDRAWNLNLTPSVPLSLKIGSAVGDSQIDLSGLNITQFGLSAGVGKSFVTLPASGKFQADINGGVGDAIVRIPSAMAARIHLSTGIGSSDISTAYGRQGDFYLSPGFDTASSHVELKISGGVGRVTVQQVQSQ